VSSTPRESTAPAPAIVVAIALLGAGVACSPSLRAPTVDGPPPEYVAPAADAGPGGQAPPAPPAPPMDDPAPRLPIAPPPSDAGTS
jgi:hypothetical protein